jgi:potassium-transporting ATPase KdpC subunit
MPDSIWIAIRTTLVLSLLTGGIYPAAITVFSQALFPKQANGSLIETGGKIIGSELIGQKFTESGYFHGRPSAAGEGYDASNSGGSNLGPTSQKLASRIKSEVEQLRKDNPDFTGSLPADLVTASASGLDPHISLASAYAQAPRVAANRGAPLEGIKELIVSHLEGRQLGFLGEPRINVLKLNLALDVKFPKKS